jgi:hypothetical protein
VCLNDTLFALRQGYEVVERMDLNADGCIAFDEFAAGLLDWEKVTTGLKLVFALAFTLEMTLTYVLDSNTCLCQ